MAIKRKVSKSEFETLTEEIKSLYVEKDGEYFLDIEGFDESAAKRAKDREKELRKEAEENARRYKEELNSLKAKKEKKANDDARNNGDLEALEKSWEKRYNDLKEELTAGRDSFKSLFESTKVNQVADSMASKLSKMPKWLARDIKERLSVDYDADGNPSLRVLDGDGKVSAMSLEDLEKEFLTNEEYADILIGSKASGGAGGSENGGAVKIDTKKVSLAEADPNDLVAHIKAKKEDN